VRGRTLFRALALAALAACYVTIMAGGNVIASDAGLGCAQWPTCEGGQFVPPLTAGPAVIEFSHRAAAFALSVLVLALAVAALLFERRRPALARLTYAALATVVLEAVLGGVVVASDLVDAIVLVHFAIATVLFTLLLLIGLLANLPEMPPRWKAWARSAMEADRPPHVLPAEGKPGSAPEPGPTPASAAPRADPLPRAG
jgi:cytochrome c oxidase assembly protein subunit 15